MTERIKVKNKEGKIGYIVNILSDVYFSGQLYNCESFILVICVFDKKLKHYDMDDLEVIDE